ncbi:C-GCAxxG-C-C family protein [Akkermansia glycaniphila]|uniref:Cgcaxxgcc motif n=1 Tax=Akkermansia glycaniphila TaxID=1679444 RepID=A0A1C7PDK1_9BACT|nr:C-GCAxxG-C-C family protein [Akkermansia glycaniphila]OCA03673.1 hypothetical protein AC781_03450 [Akkermansia glycaniphila]SEH86779.1 cgcaxxgcc motif [Akkermansia glycaniphila]
MTYPERALDFFHQGYNCAQSVLAAFADDLELTVPAALKLSSGFGAGIGRMRGVCGAFSALAMVAGFVRGNTTPDLDDKEAIFSLIRSLAAEFEQAHGSLICRDLLHLGNDVQESARPQARTAAYYASRPCEACIAFCAARGEQLLNRTAY